MDEIQDASGSKPQCEKIIDRCPSCGCQSLFVGAGGYLTCGNISTCKEPGVGRAIATLQEDLQHERTVNGALTRSLKGRIEEIHDLQDLLHFRTRTQKAKIGVALELYRDTSRIIRRLKASQPQGAAMVREPDGALELEISG